MGKIVAVQGSRAPFDVARESLKNQGLPTPEPGEIAMTVDRRYPVYRGVFWLAAGKGSGRLPFTVSQGDGSVVPNMIVKTISIASPHVEPSAINDGDLNIEKHLAYLSSQGLLRVDHLVDENGVALGFPPRESKSSGEVYRTWAEGLLNPARLMQLHTELQEFEGRSLKKPRAIIKSRVQSQLQRAKGKEPGQVLDDREKLKRAKVKLQEICDFIGSVIAGDSPTGEPKRRTRRKTETDSAAPPVDAIEPVAD